MTTDFTKILASYQSTDEERRCSAILFSDIDIQMNDSRLNHLAALTYNMQSCERLFAMVEKAIEPQNNPWKTIYKALLTIHTFTIYGSELAVDKCVNLCKYVHPLQTYNSALVKKGWFSSTGGTDYGAPVRATASLVVKILMNDQDIRKARQEARQGQNTLVPMGQSFEQHNPQKNAQMGFGQVVNTSVGAGFSLEAVPGMYEGRPDRYFDNANDPRSRVITGNHQRTRDALAPSLLDLAFDDNSSSNDTPNLPPVDYLPALERQRELERQLAEQQELLRKLQEQQVQQQQQQQQQQAQQYYPPQQAPAVGGYGDLLSMQFAAQPYGSMPQASQQQPIMPYGSNFMTSQPQTPMISAMAPRPQNNIDLLLDFTSSSTASTPPAAPIPTHTPTPVYGGVPTSSNQFPNQYGNNAQPPSSMMMGAPPMGANMHIPSVPLANNMNMPPQYNNNMNMNMGQPPYGTAVPPMPQPNQQQSWQHPSMEPNPYGMHTSMPMSSMDSSNYNNNFYPGFQQRNGNMAPPPVPSMPPPGVPTGPPPPIPSNPPLSFI